MDWRPELVRRLRRPGRGRRSHRLCQVRLRQSDALPSQEPQLEVATIPAGMPTGQRSRIAPSDAEQVNDMYQCLLKGGATRPPVETCLDTPGTTSITLGGR